MMKIVASLVILGLCANVALGLGVAPVVTSQSGAFSSSVLNSSAVQVLKGTNSTDSANWDSATATTAVAGVQGAWFGAGATNDTSYLWGLPYGSPSSTASTGGGSCGAAAAAACSVYSTSSFRKRTLNNTIAATGSDSTEATVTADTTVSVSITGNSFKYATGPGFFAILSKGIDTVATPNNQVWITVINATAGTATTKTLTTTADVWAQGGSTPAVGTACTTTTFSLGNVFYEWGTDAFFYTYSKTVVTSGTSNSAGACDTTSATTTVNTIYLGGIYANGTILVAPISASAVTPANSISGLVGGVDNSLAASYIWIAYKDNTAAVLTTYVSKTAVSTSTTAVGSFSALVKDTSTGSGSATNGAGTNYVMTYTPVTVWASNVSYAVTVMNTTVTTVWTGAAGSGVAGTPTTNYGYTNYFNGTTTGTDAGVSVASTTGSTTNYQAWNLNTGYTVVYAVTAASGSPPPVTLTYGTYFANGTANTTTATAATLSYNTAQFYEDVNGAQWVGWYDEDTGNSLVYNAYLAKFQGQLNIPTGASILSAISAFVALFLAAIFVF